MRRRSATARRTAPQAAPSRGRGRARRNSPTSPVAKLHGGARHRRLAEIERRAVAADPAAHHHEADLRRAATRRAPGIAIVASRLRSSVGGRLASSAHRGLAPPRPRHLHPCGLCAEFGVIAELVYVTRQLTSARRDDTLMTLAAPAVGKIMRASGDSAMTANGAVRRRHAVAAIADDLERAIVQGDFVPGERLPGEVEIADRFGVNRHTVRRALSGADRARAGARGARQRHLSSRPRGCPIRSTPHTRFSEIVGAAGRQAGGRLLGSAVEAASEHIAGSLLFAPGTPVVRLDILRSVDRIAGLGRHDLAAGRARAEGRAVLPRDALDDARRSRVRGHCGLSAAQHARFGRRRRGGATRRACGSRPGRPLIVVDSVDVTPDGRPILATRAPLRGGSHRAGDRGADFIC